MYTIKEAAARTGVSIELLRAWERRYGIVAPSRTAGGYRIYDEGALARLRAMRELIDEGWTPSNAAAAVLAGRVAPDVAVIPSLGPTATRGPRSPVRAGGRVLGRGGLETVLDEMMATGSFEPVVEAQLLPALRELGAAWQRGELDVAAEHAASHAVHRRLAAAYQASARADAGIGPVLVGLPSGSRHELGALAFSVAARRAGVNVLYLGPDLPAADWVSTAARTRARAAVIGVVSEADVDAAVETARALHGAAARTRIAFGGREAATAHDAASRGDDPVRRARWDDRGGRGSAGHVSCGGAPADRAGGASGAGRPRPRAETRPVLGFPSPRAPFSAEQVPSSSISHAWSSVCMGTVRELESRSSVHERIAPGPMGRGVTRDSGGFRLVCEPGRTGCPDPRGSNRTTGLTKFQRVASCRVMR